MLLEGFWALAALLDPTAPQLVLGLALVAAAILIVAATALPTPAPTMAVATFALSRRARAAERPRLADPDAPGRPRSRAPALSPAAA
ncbi:hypothetical protein [Actinoplanes sp. NPDC026619]|uniref:hypothetical protein n=1 Tax=Actinoplanes sp. NPDC026619 TaxID=3155798 RepID=UPI0033F09DA3